MAGTGSRTTVTEAARALAARARALATAAAPSWSAFLVEGAGGSGRSHLLAELRARLEAEGWQAFAARGYPGRGSVLRTLPEATRELARALDEGGAALLDHAVRELLRRIERAEPFFHDVDPSADAAALMAGPIGERLAGRPALWLLDDADLVHRAAWRWLAAAGQALRAPAMLVAASAPGFEPPVAVERFPLGPPTAVELAAALRGRGVDAAIVEAAASRLAAHGEDFHGAELVADELAAAGATKADEADALAALPRAELHRRRLARLPEDERVVLAVASLSPGGVNLWRLDRIGIGTREEALALTDELVARGFLRPDYPSGRLHLVLRHAPEQALAREAMDEQQRRFLHARLAAVVDGDEDVGRDERHGEAGRHLLEAGDMLAGVGRLLEAGRHMLNRGRVADARALFLELQELCARDRALRAEGLLAREGLGDVDERTGAPQRVAATFRALLEEGRELLGPVDLARLTRKAVHGLMSEGRFDEAEALLAAAIERLRGRDLAEQARLCEVMARVAQRRGDLGSARSHGQRALALARESGDERAQASVHAALGSLYEDRGELHEAEGEHRAARALFERLGDAPGMARACNGLGIVLAALGRSDEAIASYREALAIHEGLGDATGSAILLNNLATEHMGAGAHDEAEEALARCRRAHAAIGGREGECIALVNLASLAFMRRRYRDALELSRESLQLADEVGHAPTRLAALLTILSSHLALGELGRAFDVLERVRAQAPAGAQHQVWCAISESRCLHAIGDLEGAEELLLASLRACHAGGFAESEGDCLEQLVALEMARGDAARARAYLELLQRRGAESPSARRGLEALALHLDALEAGPGGAGAGLRDAIAALAPGLDAEQRLDLLLAAAPALPADEAWPMAREARDLASSLGRREEQWRAALLLADAGRALGHGDAASHGAEAARLVLAIASELPDELRDRYLDSHGRRRALIGARLE